MRLVILVVATVVAAMSLPVASASASPSRSARKAKLAKRSRMDNAPMVVETGSARRTKRQADDPVLRRYGKRPEDLTYVDYKSKRAKKSVAEADDSGLVIIEEDTPRKSKKTARKVAAKPAKAKPTKTKTKTTKAKKAAAAEEILIIEEESPAPKKLAKTKTRAKAKATLVDDDDDDDEITITID